LSKGLSTVYNLIKNKTNKWLAEEKENSQSLISNVLMQIEKMGVLRQPQKEAIEVYLWLKFVGKNQKLSDIVRQGLLYDEAINAEYKFSNLFSDNYSTLFLYQFANDNGLKNFEEELLKDKDNENWEKVLDELLHDFPYSNYLFSLPMGAGKTYLMACFIYLDLYFAGLFKDDKRFAHNFIVFAPQASKTAILPSLKTIKDFNPEWILPTQEAEKLKQIIHVEILDSLSSQRKDKLQGNNPNLEKVNRLNQSKDFGLVFITNAEKVVMEKYSELDKEYINPDSILYDEKKAEDVEKINELRERLSQLPNFTVILDEVHHSYGETKDGEKKLRLAVNILNQHGSVNSVIGLSGTPYVKNKVNINGKDISLTQIQDIVYNYQLNQGIGKFLKIPDIKQADLELNSFIKQALSDFFNNYDVQYLNGTKSKVAFYCPTIEKLNEEILPVIQEWYTKNRPDKKEEIFRYYTNVDKKNEQYKLPKDSLAIFHNLDKPYCEKRVVLLVAVGTEGWDCKSLTAVVLPRKMTTKNFVLQTTCRCLREVDGAKDEKALIYLSKDNYETLDKELKENYQLTISDLKQEKGTSIDVQVRKPKLGTLKYNQITTKWKLVKKITTKPEELLKDFKLDYYKDKFSYDTSITKGKIGSGGLTGETTEKIKLQNNAETIDFINFIYSISKNLYGKYSETELMKSFPDELKHINDVVNKNIEWLEHNPHLKSTDLIKDIATNFADSSKYEKEILKSDTTIELLEWDSESPKIECIDSNGRTYKLMPKLKDIKSYIRHPDDIEEDFFKNGNNIDPQDISYNYVPYRMDSEFEQNALSDMLKLSELAGLEVYFNGYKDNKLQVFYIETPRGKYTPDFLILKRAGNKKYKNKDEKGEIEKILILETKGKPYYNEEFKAKEKFVREEFITHNPNFTYHCCIDEGGKNDFSKYIGEFRELISKF